MKQNRKFLFVILIAVVIGVTAMPVINVSCENYGYTEFVPMCHMHTIGQINGHLNQYKDINIAIVIKSFTLLFLVLVLISVKKLLNNNRLVASKININFIKFKNISPWDNLKIAFTRGIIHNKILPNN